ncbi:hypothetical protein O181_046996 [Austropuccinia psidii MF-1]|uniref:Uncharacterized protein n=1 Tax=Austropuccinia psidii MF-1 TaxID=1389203 RepID=A0A9Q3HJ49_9BASI|nr:hypothetical protein [Austropuccinia psidii MF-1]
MPGELEHAVKSRCNHNSTLDDISNTLKDVRKELIQGSTTHIETVVSKRNNLSGYSLKTTPEKEWQKWLRRRILATIVVQQTTMPTTVQRQRKKSMPLRKSKRRNPQKRILNQTLWVMPSENNLMMTQDPREEFLVEYKEETPLEIQEIHLEAGMPHNTAKKNLCKHTQDAQTLLVIPTKGMAYIHGTATKMNFFIDNSQHRLISDRGEHWSIVAISYLNNHF